MKNIIIIICSIFVFSCTNHKQENTLTYTCPMPEDSVFTYAPGKCPKCGMKLILLENHLDNHQELSDSSKAKILSFSCPMHPQIQRVAEGNCPICGMLLEITKSLSEPNTVSLYTLLKPANQQVIAKIPMVHAMERKENIEMESYGVVTYDTRKVGTISSNFSGRIEKIYVKYLFQRVSVGQKIMDIYSPELMTAQENLLFLLKNDAENELMINAAKQKLDLLGMSHQQLKELINSRQLNYRVSVYSKYEGNIRESNLTNMGNNQSTQMSSSSTTTQELNLKEGMYVQKGQNIFSVFNSNKAWVLLNIFSGNASMVKTGYQVKIIPESNQLKSFDATIDFIEPVFRTENKTIIARVYFDNSTLKIPIGTQVKATIFAGFRSANWLPVEAVLSMGLEKVVFVRNGESFLARKIETGITNKHLIQVLNGLKKTEAVASNAQYLVDSESFIKTN